MRVIPWIRAEIRDWLGVEKEMLGINEQGMITFAAPHPDKVEGRKALRAIAKSPWAITIGGAIVAGIVVKLL